MTAVGSRVDQPAGPIDVDHAVARPQVVVQARRGLRRFTDVSETIGNPLESGACRIGGDEFVAVVDDVDVDEAERVAARFCGSTHADHGSLRSHGTQNDRHRNHSIRRPDIAREMTSCWISDVPSKIVWLISGDFPGRPQSIQYT